MDITKLSNRITTLEQELTSLRGRGLPFPIPRLDRRNINRDLPVIKRIDGDVYTVEINDREYSWDFGAGGGGGGGASTATLIVGPASNADSADYDYTTDGTDDDVQIQAAIDALPATGGKVICREGSYEFGAGVSSSKIGVVLQGVGRGTVFTPENNAIADNSIITLSGAYSSVRDIYFDGLSRTPSSGALSALTISGQNAFVSGCDFLNWDSDCITGSQGGGGILQNCYFENWNVSDHSQLAIARWDGTVDSCYFVPGIGDECVDLQSNSLSVIRNCYFYLPDGYLSTVVSGALTIDGNIVEVENVVDSAVIFSGGAYSRIINNIVYLYSESSSGGGTVIDCGQMSTISNNVIIGSEGFAIYASNDCNVTGNVIDGCAEIAIRVGSNSTVTGNRIIDPGQLTNNTYDAIYLASIDRCSITGNRITSTATNKMRYGINISNSACDKNIVSNNIITGGVTGQFNDAGTGTVTDGSNVTS